MQNCEHTYFPNGIAMALKLGKDQRSHAHHRGQRLRSPSDLLAGYDSIALKGDFVEKELTSRFGRPLLLSGIYKLSRTLITGWRDACTYLPLGAASVQLFDQASRSLFAKVISVSGRPLLRAAHRSV
jgi:hypothetical protein